MPAWHAPNLAINCIENTREKNASEDPYQYGSFFSLLHSSRFEVISFQTSCMVIARTVTRGMMFCTKIVSLV